MTELSDWLENRFTRALLACVVYLGAVRAVRDVYRRLDELESAQVRAAMFRHPAGRRLSAVQSA